MAKLSFLAGLVAGYVLGARAGRERYEQMASKAKGVWQDPRVQEKAGQAEQAVREKVNQAEQVVKEKATEVEQAVKEKASGASSDARSSGAHTPGPPAPSAGGGPLS